MEIIRNIGRHQVLVDVNASREISLEEATLRAIPATSDRTSLSKKDIFRSLSSGDEYLPLSLHWELLDRCNFSCPFCYIVGHSFNRLVRFSQIRQHLSELVDEGLLFCTLTGGEVTIHPDFGDIYTFLKQKGVLVEVFTNGYRLDGNLINLFEEYRPYAVEVSLYSMNDHKMKTVYGASSDQAATAVRANILDLKRRGIQVVCKTFLNKLTAPDFDDIVHWCEDQGLEHYSSSELTPAYDGINISDFKVTGDKERPAPAAPTKTICFPCGTKNYGCALTSSFEIYPCPSIRHRDCYFDVQKLGVRECLQRMKSFMRKFQDTEIVGSCNSSTGCKTCIAFATPVRNDAGDIVFFSQ